MHEEDELQGFETEKGAESADGFEEEPAAEGAAEQPEENAGEETEAEGAAKKPEQTPEERARFADVDRKRRLEEQRVAEQELLGALADAGIEAKNAREAAQVVRQLALQAQQEAERQEQEQRLLQMQQEAEETGVPLDVLQAREEAARAKHEADQIRQSVQQERAAALYEADKLVVGTIDPKFFETASEMQIKAFGAMRISGIDPITALSMVKGAPAAKSDPGTGHMVPTKGGASAGVDIPKDVLRDYLEMGYTKEQAAKDYKRQMKKGK